MRHPRIFVQIDDGEIIEYDGLYEDGETGMHYNLIEEPKSSDDAVNSFSLQQPGEFFLSAYKQLPNGDRHGMKNVIFRSGRWATHNEDDILIKVYEQLS